MTISTPEKIKKALKTVKVGRTVPELAAKVGASLDTTRRSVTRLMARGEVEYDEYYKVCTQTGKELTAYHLAH